MSWTSRLMIYDFDEARSFPVLETDGHIAAPNWTPDGSALIVNGEGSLFWVPLDAPELLEIDTGLCIKLNNDHGITPDGETLIYSDHSFGQGAVVWAQSLSDEGADPKQITPIAPSWWHGVSPDGTRIAYTAVRNGQFGIYTCDTERGAADFAETCVVEGAEAYDGPDFSPDGQWIWFNSDRAGGSDLWRVRVDGTDLEQMSNDERVNWFPHPAPEGDKVVYLSYPNGTQGHPENCDVELRQFMGKDRAPKTLVSLFGGQGTLNVPSWSPDGVAFAYVEYARR